MGYKGAEGRKTMEGNVEGEDCGRGRVWKGRTVEADGCGRGGVWRWMGMEGEECGRGRYGEEGGGYTIHR